MTLLVLSAVIVGLTVEGLLYAWEDRTVLGNVGQRHLRRDVVFTLECAKADVVRRFLFEGGSAEVVESAFTDDGVAVDLVYGRLSCTRWSAELSAY